MQMTSFDFVLLLIISEACQNAMLGNDYSITAGVLAIVTLSEPTFCSLIGNIAQRRRNGGWMAYR